MLRESCQNISQSYENVPCNIPYTLVTWLFNFRLSQTKYTQCTTIVPISLVVASKCWSYVALWKRFKDTHCHGLVTKDKLWIFCVFAAMTYVNKNSTWNDVLISVALKLKTVEKEEETPKRPTSCSIYLPLACSADVEFFYTNLHVLMWNNEIMLMWPQLSRFSSYCPTLK